MAAGVIVQRGRVVVVGYLDWLFGANWDSDWIPMTGREVGLYWTAQRKTVWSGSGYALNFEAKLVETGTGAGWAAQYSRMYFTPGGGGAAQLDGAGNLMGQAQPMARIQVHDDAHPPMSLASVMQAVRVHYVDGSAAGGEYDENVLRIAYDSTAAAGLGYNVIMSQVGLV